MLNALWKTRVFKVLTNQKSALATSRAMFASSFWENLHLFISTDAIIAKGLNVSIENLPTHRKKGKKGQRSETKALKNKKKIRRPGCACFLVVSIFFFALCFVKPNPEKNFPLSFRIASVFSLPQVYRDNQKQNNACLLLIPSFVIIWLLFSAPQTSFHLLLWVLIAVPTIVTNTRLCNIYTLVYSFLYLLIVTLTWIFFWIVYTSSLSCYSVPMLMHRNSLDTEVYW